MLCNKKLNIFLMCICMSVIFPGCSRTIELDLAQETSSVATDEEATVSEDGDEFFSQADNEEDEEKADVAVHVCGAVISPGVYYFPEQVRVTVAIEAAGGFTSEAAKDYLNLAAFISDGQQIYVPTLIEEADYKKQEKIASQHLIDINAAGKEVLMTLPGIGESRALDIISYREKNGAFLQTEDIMKVSGIKQSVFDKICDMICVK